MSNVGKTMVKGHGLIDEGSVGYDSQGRETSGYWTVRAGAVHAKCRCGELSPPGISQNAAKKWHRQHKADVLAAEEDPQ